MDSRCASPRAGPRGGGGARRAARGGAPARPAAPQPDIAGVPLAGGLVGFAAYDVVRHFERLPARAPHTGTVPELHYVAPRSVLGFDHLPRGVALVHAGSEQERRSLRAEVVCALRGGLPNGRRSGRYAA